MEALSLSLSRLQVLCHSLSKVLFKLSLTLLVRYRSSYYVFNFGRHIPAAWHCTPKQCYSLDSTKVRYLGFWLNGLTPSLAQYSHEGLCSAMGLLWSLNFANPAPIKWPHYCHNSRPYNARFGNEFGPSSLAAHWGNHGCFLFLRWVICLSSAGDPAALRSVWKYMLRYKESYDALIVFVFTNSHGISSNTTAVKL